MPADVRVKEEVLACIMGQLKLVLE